MHCKTPTAKLNWKNMVWVLIMFLKEYQQSVFIKFFYSSCPIGYFSVLVSLKLALLGFQSDCYATFFRGRADILTRL